MQKAENYVQYKDENQAKFIITEPRSKKGTKSRKKECIVLASKSPLTLIPTQPKERQKAENKS